MNSLEDIYKAVKEMVYLIGTAYQAGMCECLREIPQGGKLCDRIRVERDERGALSLVTDSRRVYLSLADFGSIAKDLGIIYFVACKAAEHLSKKLEGFEGVKETLAPFILQEKLS